MTFKRPRHLGIIIAAVVIVGIIIYALLPAPIEVEVATVRRMDLRGEIEAEARIRCKDRYVLSLPSTATLVRVVFEPGDTVTAGDVLATFYPPTLDVRQRDELRARAQAAGAAIAEASSRIAAMEPIVEQARRKQRRMLVLFDRGAVSSEQSEMATDATQQLERELEAARSRLVLIAHERDAALAAARAPTGSVMTLRAPTSGVILRRYEEQERLLPAGTPVIEVSRLGCVEVVVDVISTDAVNIKPGMVAVVEGWGKDIPLPATVLRVEPAARTKVSALGVEEQRVDVILRLDTVEPTLGDNYKVDARIIRWRNPSALTVPQSALMRDHGAWKVYVERDGRATARNVTIGRRTTLQAEVLAGLAPNDRVITHPPEALRDGATVSVSRVD
jgi:HlyD family secretion protein